MKQTLSIENEPLDFGETAFLSIVTQEPDYILADSLNQLYDLHLGREEDLMPFGYPCYLSSSASHAPLVYRLVHLVGTDRGFLLIVSGSERAHGEVARICAEFNSPSEQPHPYDLPAIERQEILRRYRENFTLVDDVRFTDDDLAMASSPGRRTLKGRAALADHYARILDAIDLAEIPRKG